MIEENEIENVECSNKKKKKIIRGFSFYKDIHNYRCSLTSFHEYICVYVFSKSVFNKSDINKSAMTEN